MSPQIGQASELIFRDDYTACPVRPRGFVHQSWPQCSRGRSLERECIRQLSHCHTVVWRRARYVLFTATLVAGDKGPSVMGPPLAEQDGSQTDGTVSTYPV